MFWLLFIALFISVKACDEGNISFDGNLEKCATQPLYFLDDFNCAFFWHDNCGGRRLGICDENPDFSKQGFQYDASAVVVREGCIATACHGYHFSDGCATFGPGYHNFWFSKQLTSNDIEKGIPGPRGFNDHVKSAKCKCTFPTTKTTTILPSTSPIKMAVTQKLETIEISKNITDNNKKFIYTLDILLFPKIEDGQVKPTKNSVIDF